RNRVFFLLIAVLAFNAGVYGQVNRYMVFFEDKEGTHFSIDEPLEFLSPRAIERRIRQGISITEMDLPVNETYVQGVAATGADVFFRTRWANGVLVHCDAALVP